MASIRELRCTICGRTYSPEEQAYTCPICGQVGTLDVLYDYDALRASIDRDRIAASREDSMWRYRELLPIGPESPVPPLRVGWTPFYDTPRLAETLNVHRAWVKDDGQNPTASFKDRASAMVVARAMERGIKVVTTASTGNAAAALAGLGASVGLQTIIFVPASAPEAKIAQLLVYGAQVLLVEASYDVAFDLCLEISLSEDWYCRSTGINPFTTEGKKTAAYEIAEQSGWNPPDVVIVSVGDGSIIGGLHKGFVELRELGWIERIPRLIGVQSKGSAPLVHAWQENISAADMQPVTAHSIADSIVAGLPRDRAKALRAVRETGGAFVAVPDDAILAAIPGLARCTGIFAEPAAAATFAGAQRAVELGLIYSKETVMLISTGSGLKDVASARQAVGSGLRVPADVRSIQRALAENRMTAG
jgi:threonine synthase